MGVPVRARSVRTSRCCTHHPTTLTALGPELLQTPIVPYPSRVVCKDPAKATGRAVPSADPGTRRLTATAASAASCAPRRSSRGEFRERRAAPRAACHRPHLLPGSAMSVHVTGPPEILGQFTRRIGAKKPRRALLGHGLAQRRHERRLQQRLADHVVEQDRAGRRQRVDAREERRTASWSRYCNSPSINQAVGAPGSKPADCTTPLQSSARSTPMIARSHLGCSREQLGLGHDDRGLVHFEHRGARRPRQPVGPRVQPRGQDRHLSGGAGGSWPAARPRPRSGCEPDLRRRLVTDRGDQPLQHLPPGVTGQPVGERIVEQAVLRSDSLARMAATRTAVRATASRCLDINSPGSEISTKRITRTVAEPSSR